MSFNKKNISVHTWDTHLFDLENNNLYESVVAMSRRACVIAAKQKEEISNRMADYSASHDGGVDEIHENREQIEISRYYEKQPKPSLQSVFEFLEGEYAIECDNRHYQPFKEVKAEREAKESQSNSGKKGKK